MKAVVKSLLLMGFSVVLFGCTEEKGQLEIHANGEDFVREGFQSKDGWNVSFEKLFVTLNNIKAYQTNPPYDASNGEQPKGDYVSIAQPKTVDLALGDASAAPIVVETLKANTGQYNAIGWEMIQGDNGYTLQLIGSAQKAGQTIAFDIKIDETYDYVCGEFVGDQRNGFVNANDTGNIEMTFHFDHLFGDAGSDANEPLNVGALGFEPLALLAVDGKLDVTQSQLKSQLSAKDYATLLDTLATLGHVGEGHCFEAKNGYTKHDG